MKIYIKIFLFLLTTFSIFLLSTNLSVYAEDNTRMNITDIEIIDSEKQKKTIKFVASNGEPLSNTLVIINNLQYITNSEGEIFVTDLEEGNSYIATISYNSKDYTTDLLGVSDSVVLDIEQTDENRDIYIYLPVGILILGIVLFVIFKNKK
jgi:hypothetical protein